MSFAERERSRALGQPDTLYHFSVGSRVFAYTDAEEPITVGALEYIPTPIDRDQVSSTGNLDKTTMKISLPTSTDLVELFRVYPPSDVTTVVISQGHWSDPEYLVIWSGKVLSCDRTGLKATLACEPVTTSMRRPGLRRRYMRGCMHKLYGPSCKASQAANTVTATVSSVNGIWVELAGGWNGSFPASRFPGGVFNANGEMRTIQEVQGDRIRISHGLLAVEAGDTVSLSLGCEHTVDACKLFSNILNYGGQPWIPVENPFANVNRFG